MLGLRQIKLVPIRDLLIAEFRTIAGRSLQNILITLPVIYQVLSTNPAGSSFLFVEVRSFREAVLLLVTL